MASATQTRAHLSTYCPSVRVPRGAGRSGSWGSRVGRERAPLCRGDPAVPAVGAGGGAVGVCPRHRAALGASEDGPQELWKSAERPRRLRQRRGAEQAQWPRHQLALLDLLRSRRDQTQAGFTAGAPGAVGAPAWGRACSSGGCATGSSAFRLSLRNFPKNGVKPFLQLFFF